MPTALNASTALAAFSQEDDIAVRVLRECLQHESQVAAVPGGSEPTTTQDIGSSLPALAWFSQLSWGNMQAIGGSTFVQIPRRLEEGFCDARGIALKTIAQGGDDISVLAGWKAFLLLPWLLLFKPGDASEADSCATLLADRLDRFWQGDVESILRDHIHANERILKTSASRLPNTAATAKKVKTLCRAGESGRALRAAEGAERVIITRNVAGGLAALFSVDRESADMIVDSTGTFEQVNCDVLMASLLSVLHRLPRLSAPGPLQMRNEHLTVLVANTLHAPSLLEALASLGDGSAPLSVVQFLRGGLLTPLEKDDGTYRPLTLSNVIRRASLKAVLQQHRDDVMAAVGNLQYGVARKAGIDALHKSLQTRVATYPTNAVVSIDFRAAFQTLDRGEACEAVARYAPALEKTCRAWYAGQASHSVFDIHGCHHIVPTDRGVDQGCPLGAFMFAVAMRDLAEKVLQFARSLDPTAAFYMYLDDCYFVASALIIQQIVEFAAISFREIGLEIKLGKTQSWCHHKEALPVNLQQYYTDDFRVLKRALKTPGDLEHQGAPVLEASGDLGREVERLSSLTYRLCDLVRAGLDLQTAVALLRSYAGPASQYTLRTCVVSEPSARAYHETLAKC